MTYQQISRRYGIPVEIIRDAVRQIRESPRGRLSKRDQERLIEEIERRCVNFEEDDERSPFEFR